MLKFIFSTLFLLLYLSINAQESDIPNGSFEIWNGDSPVNWGSTNVTQQSSKIPKDFQTIFKSTDSKKGKFSVHLKTPSTVDYLNNNPEYVKAMSKFPQYKKMAEEMLKKQSLSPSLFWCQGDCDALMVSNPKALLNNMKIPIKEKPKAICGFYKANLKSGDKLWINPFLQGNNGAVGGPAPDDTNAIITQNTREWTPFKIPLHAQEGTSISFAGVQFYLVGSGFPNNPPYGTNGMQLAMTIPSTGGSEVWLDDICFCDAPEMEIYNAEVVDGKKIEPALMLEMGAQTFENIDNDDQGETFDYDPEEKVSKTNVSSDDELVRLKIKMSYNGRPLTKDEVILEITKGQKNVKLWMDKEKTKEFTAADKLFIPDDFEHVGEFWEKELWVEGIEAHTEQKGTIFKMYRKEDPTEFKEAALTVIGFESIEWEGIGNSINDDNNLDYDVNFRNPSDPITEPLVDPCNCDIIKESFSTLEPKESVRVFPGKRIVGQNKTEDIPRDKVKLKVTLTVKPIYPVKLHFKAFDVDDPTLDDSYITDMDDESIPEDNIGFIEANGKKLKSGYLKGQNEEGILEVIFTQKTKILDFQVSRQPGDNFRIVGAFDEDFIKSLENNDNKLHVNNDNNDKQRITNSAVFEINKTEPEKAEIRYPEKYASSVLTVWRKAYAEVDKMDTIGKDILFSEVVLYEPNLPEPGQTKVFIKDNIIKKLKTDGITEATMGPTHTHVGMVDAFKEGEFRLSGQSFLILENSANEVGYIFNGAADYVVINGLLDDTTDYTGKKCGLKFDDENRWQFKAGDAMPDLNPDTCVLERIFRLSYMHLDFDTMNTDAINPNNLTEFRRNTNADDFSAIKSNYKFDNKGLAENKDFWCFYVNTCYAGATAEDGDPDDATISGSGEQTITGIADDEKFGINIFMEGLLEFNKALDFTTNRNNYLCTQPRYGSGKGDVIAHEIAHLFGAIHEIDKGIMNITSNKFTPLTISRIRKAKHP